MIRSMVIFLLLPTCFVGACKHQVDSVENMSTHAIRSITSFERSMQDSLFVGIGSGCLNWGEEYDSGEVVMPVRIETFDTTGRKLIDMDVYTYQLLSERSERIGDRPHTILLLCRYLFFASYVSANQALYTYGITETGREELVIKREYSVGNHSPIEHLSMSCDIVADSNLVKEERYFYNHRGNIDRIETTNHRSSESHDTLWFLYHNDGRLLGTRTQSLLWSVFGGKGKVKYDTARYYYNDYKLYNSVDEKNQIIRLDSTWCSCFFVYGEDGRLKKQIWLGDLGNYEEEIVVEWAEDSSRTERCFDVNGRLVDQIEYDVYGYPLSSTIWSRRVHGIPFGVLPILETQNSQKRGNEPLLVKEYHYELWE